jgi:hypothetical protein
MKKIKIIFVTFFAILCLNNVHSQVGIGTTSPAAALDITASNNGLLIPRVALTSTLTVLPVLTGTTSELVYNTATTGDVTPGFYYLSTATGPWIRLGTAAPLVETDPQVSSVTTDRVPKWNGTTLVDGSLFDTGTRVGIGTTSPNGMLDITSSTDGFLIPRVALNGSNFEAPLTTTPIESELIYNTTDNSASAFVGILGLVTPGFYYWKTSPAPARWERFVTGTLPPSTGWQTTGNTGIVDGTNFIGTTTAANIQFRRNNTHAGRISATSTSFGVNALTAGATTNGTAFGVNALAANTAANNTAFGTNALAANTTSENNTAVGYNALAINTPGSNTGDRNTAVGSGALANLNGGNNNTAVGYNALTNIATTTRFNTAVGSNALSGANGASAINNVAVGDNTITGTGTITQSVAVGSDALRAARDTSTRNTAIGFSAGSNITTGTDNIIIGTGAQTSSASSVKEIVIGAGTIHTAYVNAASWSFSSDRRLKSDIKDSPLGLNFIKTIRPVSYFRKDDLSKKTEYGFIAQELETALNNAGSINNGILSHTANGMFAVRYNDFLPIAIKAIQEQQVQIEELKKANEELQKMNVIILNRLEALEKK